MKKTILFCMLVVLSACNYIEPSAVHRTKLYSDAAVEQSDLAIYIQPRQRQSEPLRALFYPFWIRQDSTHPIDLGRQCGRVFHDTWTRLQLFPAQLFDDTLVYRGRERAVAEARARGADVVIIGSIPYLFTGGTIDDTVITIQMNIYETGSGQLIYSMAQSARVDYTAPQDWILYDSITRMPDAPLYMAVTAIAEDMAQPLRAWLPAPDSALGFVNSSDEIVTGLATEPATRGTGLTASDLEAEVADTGSAAPGRSVYIKVEFDVDKSTIRPEYYPNLDELGKALVSPQLKGRRIILAGHTDSDAPDEYNVDLSRRRADAVKEYLISRYPIDPTNIITEGYGESRPVVPNDSVINKQRNRRVEVRLAD